MWLLAIMGRELRFWLVVVWKWLSYFVLFYVIPAPKAYSQTQSPGITTTEYGIVGTVVLAIFSAMAAVWVRSNTVADRYREDSLIDKRELIASVKEVATALKALTESVNKLSLQQDRIEQALTIMRGGR